MSKTLNVFEARVKELGSDYKWNNSPKEDHPNNTNVFAERIKEIDKAGGENVFSKRAKELNGTNEELSVPERGIWPAFKQGTQRGVSGLIAGYKPEALPEDASWLEGLGSMAGKFVSDYPAMIPGAAAGGLAGASIGSIIPGVGTAIGGLAGSGAGAFALPTAIDQAYEEYYKYADKGGEGTFGDFLNSVGKVAKETGKQAAIGGATGVVSKALPFLQKIPGFDRLLKTNLGRKAVGTGLEYGTLTLGQAAIEGRSPTMQEAVNNALLLGGLKAVGGTGKVVGGIGEAFGNTEIFNKVIKNHPLVKPITTIAKHMPEPVKALGRKVLDLKQSDQEKAYFDLLEDHIGERNARIVESQFKWRGALEQAEQQKKFTPEQLEEMMYYRQKTGNPTKKGDSYEALSSRLPEHAKEFVNEVVGPHLDKSLELWNSHPLTNKINPREALEGVYLPGLYENKPGEINKAYDEVSRRFKTKNPFSNKKTFMSYMDAMAARGLTPRYKNIVDLMRAYDNINIKVLTNLEFLEKIKSAEKAFAKGPIGLKDQGMRKLIVNSTNRKQYDKAKMAGYIPFDDAFLRRYVSATKEVMPNGTFSLFRGTKAYDEFIGQLKEAGVKNEKKPVFATTAAPALVHPELAPALQGVFRKNPYKDPNMFYKAVDALSNEIKNIEVVGSLFHYSSLFHHTGGLLGAKKALQSVAPWYTDFKADADALLKNKKVMMDAARSGLVVHRNVEGLGEQKTMISKSLDYIADKLPSQAKDTRFGNWAAGKIERGMKHLFEVHHPRLKIKAWNDMVNKWRSENPKGNLALAKKEIAKNVNNIFGGQNWETMRFLNDPDSLKIMRRVIAFPDWTLSQIRAADVGLPRSKASIAQKEARKYWLQYGLFLGATHGLMKWLYGGLEQTDQESKSPTGIRFNPKKAFNALNPFQQDPKSWYKVQLPDIPMKIAGKEFNPGRSEDGRRLNMQAMKSALELGGWAMHPFVEFFKKSNPLIRAAYKQIQDYTPTEDGTFPVRAIWEKGPKRGKPWEGTKPWTVERFRSRGKELASEFKPFSGGVIERLGVAPFIASGLGAGAVSKGMSLSDSESYIESALSSRNSAKLNNIKRVLKDNGYSEKQIKSRISLVNNRMKKES